MRYNIFEEFKLKLGKETAFDFHGPFALFFVAVSWTHPWDKNKFYMLGVNKGRDSHFVFSDDRYKNTAKEKFSKFMLGQITVDSQKKIHEDISKNADKLYQKFSVPQNLNHLDFSELKKELKASRDTLSNLAADTLYIETFDKDIILSNVDNETANKISALWEEMTHPTVISFESRRNKFILDTFEEKGLKETAILARYIYTDYFTAQNLNFVEDRIKDIVDRKEEVEEKINNQKKIIKKNTESLSVKIKKETQKVKDIVEYTQFVINQRDLRKDPIAKFQTVMYDLASEIFKRIKLPEESFLGFITDEIIEMDVDDKKSILKELEMRKSGVAVLIRPDSSYEILHMKFEDALKKLDDIVHGIKHDGKKELKGSPASKGFVSGKVRIVIDVKNAIFKEGEILVTSMTRPEFVPLMKKAGGIITNEGGITSHAAIISRELGIPCIIGTKIATKILHDGDLVEVDADKGVVRIMERAEGKEKDEPIDKYLSDIGNQKIYASIANTSPLLYFSKWNKNSYFAKHFKNTTPFFVAGVARRGEMFAYPTENTLADCSIEFLKNYLSHPEILAKTKSEISQYVDKTYKLYEKYPHDIISKLNFPSKIDLLTQTLDLICEGSAWGAIAVHFDKKYLLSKLTELGNPVSLEDIELMWETAIHPVEESFVEEQKRYLLSLVIKQLPLREISENCQHFYTSYLDVKDVVWVEDRLKKEYPALLDPKQAKEAISIMDKKLASRRNKYKKWFTKLNQNQKVFASYIQTIIFVRDVRKSILNRGLTIVWRIAEGIAHKSGIPREAIPFLTVDELRNGISYISDHKDEIEGRLNGVCHYCDSDGNLIISPCDYELEKKRLDERLHGSIQGKNDSSINGQTGAPGKIVGRVKIVFSVDDKNVIFNDGEILVAGMTRPEYVPLMKKASAIITDEGGITCHAAIVSRELGIPCVIATKIATKFLHDGDLVEVDADNGVVRIMEKAK